MSQDGERMTEEELKKIIKTGDHNGVKFYDIAPLVGDPKALRDSCAAVADWAKTLSPAPTHVVGLESRGFIFGPIIALALNVGFVMVRKKGKLPPPVVSYNYKKEYGEDTIELNEGSIPKDASVLVVDDILATGGSAIAGAKLVEQAGGKVAGMGFLIDLNSLGGMDKIQKEYSYKSFATVTYKET
eukprot:CAMPEP_0201511640 /NCGR_PEP_ID=MMETSP0161_2-20130828/4060_1 /ASSEMBLY_ACC=CAM_ASM_000251 /TAXON_ID=180227 /ORGANISM="Neoparamoeba aestuarina, Strain SoJaBio B1-5/56/2" /LENGTH=185 /DNA_ID=CAMNT_0047907215 /DNA_START=44 /DNA_END=601 /DNA_ORIENTATION=+